MSTPQSSKERVSPEQELLQTIGRMLDSPSVYMGGASKQNLRRAEKLVELLREPRLLSILAGSPRETSCDACPEFVCMQHEIARLLGVDDDTDSLALHDRILDAIRAPKANGDL